MFLVCTNTSFQPPSELLTELESSSPTLSFQGRSSPVPVKTVVEEEYNEEEDGDDGNDGDDADDAGDADKADDADDGGFGDDFDDFEEGEDDAEFGDFDDGFQEPETTLPSQPIPVIPSFVSSLSLSVYNNISFNPNMSSLFSPFST